MRLMASVANCSRVRAEWSVIGSLGQVSRTSHNMTLFLGSHIGARVDERLDLERSACDELSTGSSFTRMTR